MKFRKATVEDMDQMIELRKKQLVDEGIEPSVDIDAELLAFFTNKLQDGTLIQWLAEDKGEIIATSAVVYYEFPPSYTNKSGRKAYITNMYTKDHYRGQGIGTSMLKKTVHEAQAAGISKIWLGASEMGRPVYKKFGFIETDEWMELNFS